MKKLINKLFSYQGIRFLFVGGLNTLVGYGVYALLLFLNVNYLVANTISTIVGIAHSYLWNRFFTFKSKDKALGEITKFVSVYAVSYAIGMCTLYIFKAKLNISPYIAGLLNLVITTLISYFGHKYISFRKHNIDINKIKEKILTMKTGPTKLEWALLIIILVFCYFSYNHLDITATATHGKDLLECILQGKFFEFYDYTKSTAVYLIPLYLLFAIWSIPVMIVYKIMNINMWGTLDYDAVRTFLLWWYKLLPTLFTVATAFVLVKIVKKIGLSETKQKWVPFIFMSFPPLIFSQFIFGQYDSICMFFTTLAMYYYFDKKIYKFSLIMSIAITFKLFPLFLFIPLLLLAEKRIIKLVGHMAIALIPTALCNLMFFNSPGFMDAKDFTSGMIYRFFMSGIETFTGVISYFLLIFMGVCVYAYIKKIDKDDINSFISNAVYLALVSYGAFFIFVLWHPQWTIIYVPLLILALVLNNNEKATSILYMVLSLGYLFVVLYNFVSNVDEVLMNFGFFPMVFNKYFEHGGMFGLLINKVFKTNPKGVCTILFMGTLIITLILKSNMAKNPNIIEEKKKEKTFTFERGYLLLQIAPIFFYILSTLYLYFIYYK